MYIIMVELAMAMDTIAMLKIPRGHRIGLNPRLCTCASQKTQVAYNL